MRFVTETDSKHKKKVKLTASYFTRNRLQKNRRTISWVMESVYTEDAFFGRERSETKLILKKIPLTSLSKMN